MDERNYRLWKWCVEHISSIKQAKEKKSYDPVFVVGTPYGAHPSLALSTNEGDSVFRHEGRYRERKVTSLYSLKVDGVWMTISEIEEHFINGS